MPTCGYCKVFKDKRVTKVLLHQKRDHCQEDLRWAEVIALDKAGEESKADRLRRDILGVKVEMSEEAKEKLRQYAEEHKEEIAEKRKLKAMERERLKARVAPTGKPIKPPVIVSVTPWPPKSSNRNQCKKCHKTFGLRGIGAKLFKEHVC